MTPDKPLLGKQGRRYHISPHDAIKRHAAITLLHQIAAGRAASQNLCGGLGDVCDRNRCSRSRQRHPNGQVGMLGVWRQKARLFPILVVSRISQARRTVCVVVLSLTFRGTEFLDFPLTFKFRAGRCDLLDETLVLQRSPITINTPQTLFCPIRS